MPELTTLAAFCVATLALVATPGPAVGVIVTATLRRGRASGLAAVAGIAVGDLVQVAAAVLGLAALLAASTATFTVVKVAGALWLVWLAVRSLRARTPGTLAGLATGRDGTAGADVAREHRATTRSAALVGILNPKPALFHLAFLPQFVDPARGPVWAQMAVLGLVFTLLAVAGNVGWMLGGTALRRLAPRLRLVVVERFSAGVYAAFAALALTARRVT